MTSSLILFDDQTANGFSPFSVSRPVGELLFGAFLLRERAEGFWGLRCSGHISREDLVGFSESGAPPVLRPAEFESKGSTILQSSRVALRGPAPDGLDRAATLFLGDAVVGWFLPPGTPLPESDFLEYPRSLPGSEQVEVAGRILDAPWDLMHWNSDQLRADIPRSFPGYAAEELPGCHILGEGLLSLGSDVSVDPGSIFDTRSGPIRLSDGVTVKAQTHLVGPAFVGEGSTILGGVLSGVSIGPVCKVRGEVEGSVVLGFTNKAHDGFLGHAYLGRWVNLGAFTTNSDLKNSYGTVRIGGPTGPVDTGLTKVGCFLGDHVKTGIGTLLNTGTVVGMGSNLFGGVMPPTNVPAFSWGSGDQLGEYRLDKFLDVAAKAVARRDVILSDGMVGVLRRAWEITREERRSPE
jgi:UDP-N-acetylglucosamine diphosphorylase/glucosamine-1-phosphate N-acetyltransferase